MVLFLYSIKPNWYQKWFYPEDHEETEPEDKAADPICDAEEIDKVCKADVISDATKKIGKYERRWN